MKIRGKAAKTKSFLLIVKKIKINKSNKKSKKSNKKKSRNCFEKKKRLKNRKK